MGADGKQAWRWMSGRVVPYGQSLVRLSEALGVPVERVLRACLEARARRLAELEAERVRREAE